MVIHEEMLFINKLIETRSETIYAAVYDFLHNNGIKAIADCHRRCQCCDLLESTMVLLQN